MAQSQWDPKKYPPSIIEAVATQTLLFNLGYDFDKELFVHIDPNNICVLLKIEGLDDISLRIGKPELSPGEMQQKWVEVAHDWKHLATKEEKDAIFLASKAWAARFEIAARLAAMGLVRMLRVQMNKLN